MQYVQGDILLHEGFVHGYLGFSAKSQAVEIGKGVPPAQPVAKGVILPTLVNAHTHLGDAFIRTKKLPLPRSVSELVRPPDGVKFQLLKGATEQEVVQGMQQAVSEMSAAGTAGFCDFREGGLIGIFQLRRALRHSSVHAMILSRPSQMKYEREEVDWLLQNSDGIGLSSLSDWEPSEIEKIAAHTRRKNKMFAVHASEILREDVDRILELRPGLLVHMIQATQADLQRVHDAGIPVVICPRSYSFFHLKHNFSLMKQTKVTVLLGTDNAMINTPDVSEEVRFLRNSGSFSTEELLKMVTYTPRKALNLDDDIQGPTLLQHFIVLEKGSLKLLYRR
ncbi:MAG: amidohydrolase family protein [Candidatus Thermoplasmatota archaeon]|nr:amidohydrolase family protein [Candidatus Thermoplasmatota archaeon]